MLTLTSTDPTPDLLPLQAHFALIDWPEGRTDIGGLGVTVAMIGGGWNLDHEALFHNPNIIAPPFVPWASTETDHDTAVLGILSGWYTGTGIRGMCPEATVMPMYFGMLADTLRAAKIVLRPGSVVLLERSGGTPTDEVPAEATDEIFAAVKSLTDKGIIIVTPAGNTNANLDDARFAGKFDRAQRDSGAIFVAAAYTSGSYVGPAGFTAYGSRIDVCAPGIDIMSAGYGFYIACTNANRWYAKVAGTSYAGAMVAGACACVNSARIAAGRAPLGALEMRDLLTASGTPTDKSRLPGVQIGRMLNLRSALAYAVPSADFDGDGKVGLKDFFLFASAWGGTDARFDLDGDGKVGMGDFWLFKNAWGG